MLTVVKVAVGFLGQITVAVRVEELIIDGYSSR